MPNINHYGAKPMQVALPYWHKDEDVSKLIADLTWNFPEQQKGTLKIIGGNSTSFSTEVRVAECISKEFPFIKSIQNVFPDILKNKFPPLINLEFCESTDSGSFANTPEIRNSLSEADLGILLGDLSKNSITSMAILGLIKSNMNVPLILTRDTVDLVSSTANEFIEREGLFIVASLASVQKLFRAVYYPRPIMLSQPILPIIETLHKFTLTYPTAILTFHENQIICAYDGKVNTFDISKTSFTPLSIWSGELVARLAVIYMFNTSLPLESMLAAAKYK